MEPAAFPELCEDRLSVLVINAKGGSGKTTVATNLAAAYAAAGVTTALVDHDPQASATRVARRTSRDRARDRRRVCAQFRRGRHARLLLRQARSADRIIVDTPAALATTRIGQWVGEADRILVPVLPSAIDIKAASRFLGTLLLDPTMRARRVPIAVLANRVRHNTLVFGKLERFLHSLDIPFVTTLRDTQNFVRGAETGAGITAAPCRRSSAIARPSARSCSGSRRRRIPPLRLLYRTCAPRAIDRRSASRLAVRKRASNRHASVT